MPKRRRDIKIKFIMFTLLLQYKYLMLLSRPQVLRPVIVCLWMHKLRATSIRVLIFSPPYTNGHAIRTALRPSVCLSSVCIVA